MRGIADGGQQNSKVLRMSFMDDPRDRQGSLNRSVFILGDIIGSSSGYAFLRDFAFLNVPNGLESRLVLTLAPRKWSALVVSPKCGPSRRGRGRGGLVGGRESAFNAETPSLSQKKPLGLMPNSRKWHLLVEAHPGSLAPYPSTT